MSSTADQVQQVVQRALERFEQLAASDRPPSEVLNEMVQTLAKATGALGAVAWMPAGQSAQTYQAAARHGHGAALAMDEQSQPQPAVAAVLERTASEGKTTIAAPEQNEFQGTELHNTAQFFVPIDAVGRLMGVVQLICPAELDPKVYRQYAAFAQQGGRAVGMYLARRQSELLQSDAASQAQTLRLTQRLLELDKPQNLVHELANGARPLLEAQRVAVVGYWRSKSEVAFSDAVDTNRRAVLVRAVEMLAEHVRQQGVPVTFTRDQTIEEDDPQLAPLVEQVYELGAAEAICLTPMKSNDRVVGVMLAEYGERDAASRSASNQQALCQQAGPILNRVVRWQERPLRRTAAVLEWVRERPMMAAVKATVAIAAIAGAVYGLFFVPVSTYVETEARLAPAHLATVSSPHAGEIMDVLVETGDQVQKGDPLLKLDTAELLLKRSEIQTAIAEQRIQMRDAEQKRLAGQEPPSAVRAAELKLERHHTRLEAVNRRIDRSTVPSQIAGVVLTERPEQMEGMTAKQGQKLIEVADMSNFDLVMEVEEADLSLIEQSLRAGREVPVNFLFRAWPDSMQQGVIKKVEAISPTSAPDERQKQHVFRITVPVDLKGLSPQIALANPTGRAKLQVQPHSVAYKYGRDLWRFIQVTLLF